MPAPVPCPSTVGGVRTWFAESLADLRALMLSSRGPRGEVLHVGDVGFVYANLLYGGSGWSSVPVAYLCTGVAAGDSTWAAKAIGLWGPVAAKIGETKYVRRTTAGVTERWFRLGDDGDVNSSTDTQVTFIAPVGGKVVRVTLRPTTAGNSTTVRVDVNGVTVEAKVENTAAGTVTHFDFTALAVFSKGDRVSVSTEPAADMGNTPGTVVFEQDWSTF